MRAAVLLGINGGDYVPPPVEGGKESGDSGFAS